MILITDPAWPLVLAPEDVVAAQTAGLADRALFSGAVEQGRLRLTALSPRGGSRAADLEEVLGFVAFSSAGRAAVDRLVADLYGDAPAPPEVIELGDAKAETWASRLDTEIARALGGRLLAARRRIVSLSSALATLRREHEAVAARYLQLERAAVELEAQPVKPVFRLEPNGELIIGRGEALGASIVQRLPFGAAGLCALELFVERAPKDVVLEVTLTPLESDRILARWRREAAQLEIGWNRFDLDFALGERTFMAELQITVSGGGALVLGGGPASAARDFRARGDSEAIRPLALAGHASVPGMRQRAAGRPSEGAERELVIDRVGGFEQIAPSAEDCPGLVAVACEGGLLVQPVSDTVTTARLAGRAPAGAAGVSATAIVAHPEAGIVEFALAVGDYDPEAIDADPADPRFSGWTAAPAQALTAVSLVLSQPLKRDEDLLLFTRVPPGGDDWFCRAVFRSVRAFGEL